MKNPFIERLWISREVRLAIIVAILFAVGVVACAAGDWKAGITALGIAAAIIAAFYFAVVRPAQIPHDAVLIVRLAGPIEEDVTGSPLDQIMRRGAQSLDHLRHAFESAAIDKNVRAIVVEIASFGAGLATAHEIHRLMRAAQASGKRVIALLRDDAGLREYLVAAGAGEIVANPDTMLTMLGVATGGVFLKNALNKLKIQAQTLQWKEYKGAAETLARDTMSPAVRESMEAIVADWEKILVETISSARKLAPERARELIAAGFVSAKFAVENHLIDREGYIEDIRAEFDPESKHKVFVSLARYRRHAIFTRERGPRARIALVHASGPVISGEAPAAGEFISGVATAAQIDRASRDERVSAIVFRVNSPGGSAVGSDLVWRAVREAQGRGKPVVVSMGDVAGSGGYYVAAGADAIVAEPATITGSIGVVYAKFNLGNLLSELGVHFDFVKSAPISDAMSMARAMTDAELAQLNETVGHLYSAFTAKVAQGRRFSPEQAEAVAKGRIWSGLAAKERGLIDEVGGLSTAVAIARDRAHIAADRRHQLVTYRAQRRWLDFRGGNAEASTPWAIRATAAALGIPSRWAPAMLELLIRGGVMLLCPFIEL
ncbi:MAG TPA: signal peptide peptidase SppA [Candidatus Binatus sp.]|uniref:signal peptide peptidase SppA n=1 Tax=Candidatus Binatus sp. TaxID=2811406 RepID=UPI002B463FA8|nr:signal peptide peptidase SppA [Candidatus Binatus sp.]HKN13306.1 signal peptide peptidase SppA [Candidatus Binatus sp.]